MEVKKHMEYWTDLLEKGYFEEHEKYKFGKVDQVTEMRGDFFNFDPAGLRIAVIGCGYGRESKWMLDGGAKSVHGVDLECLREKSNEFLKDKRFTFVASDALLEEKEMIPEVDICYSMNVFQHLPENLVTFYLGLSYSILRDKGKALFQFMERKRGPKEGMTGVKETYFSYGVPEIRKFITSLGFLKFECKTRSMNSQAVWHLVRLEK